MLEMSASYGALFLCPIFINMNTLFAFCIGYLSIIVAGFYSLYTIFKKE